MEINGSRAAVVGEAAIERADDRGCTTLTDWLVWRIVEVMTQVCSQAGACVAHSVRRSAAPASLTIVVSGR